MHRAPLNDGQLPSSDLVRTSDMTRDDPFAFRRNEFVFPEMERINRAAYWDYQRERIYVQSRDKSTHKYQRHAISRSALKPNTTIEYRGAAFCPACNSTLVYRHGKRNRTVIDLRFMRYGVKRWITRHVTQRYRCRSCQSTFYSPDWRWTLSKYGPDLVSYVIYQNIELGLPQNRVALSAETLFGVFISRNTANRFKAAVAQAHLHVYDALLTKLCDGHLLHVDETGVSVMGKHGYVWVLTSMEEVAYFYTPTREGSTIQAMLKNFSGVLVSDFYSAYEAIKCPQQKCLIHLIRDLNDELLKHAFDKELKRVVGDFVNLVKPMVDTVDRRGLKKRFLGKYRISVDRFYKRLTHEPDISEHTAKIIDRLRKNRDKLFTFLEFDNVPWNNNNAEHAIKAFALIRRVIDGKTTEKGLRDFLILLSIRETCKYKNVDFLGFLRSGSKDIDGFAQSRQKHRVEGTSENSFSSGAGWLSIRQH
jgi:hypothetical protein